MVKAMRAKKGLRSCFSDGMMTKFSDFTMDYIKDIGHSQKLTID